MSHLEIVHHQMGYLLGRGLSVFDKAILKIPPDKLDFRPTPANMRARELAHHVYEVLDLLTRAIESGHARFSELEAIPFDLEAATHPREIVAYGTQVKAYVRRTVAGFTEDDLARTIRAGRHPTGFDTMTLAFEEAIHHRGQLQVYLRLLGVAPPFLYDWDDDAAPPV